MTPPIAAQAPASSGTPPLTLTDAEKADVLSHNTEASVATARAGLDTPQATGPRVHGEIGAGIGSNGMRTIYGAAAVPLGVDANAYLSFEKSRFGRRR